MGRNEQVFSGKQSMAIVMTADGRLSGNEIARRLRIGRATLTRWRARPAFREQVRRIVEESVRQAEAQCEAERAATLTRMLSAGRAGTEGKTFSYLSRYLNRG